MKNKLLKGYEVEICVELPFVEGTTDADIDRAKYVRRDFATRDEAIKHAIANLDRDKFGSVVVTEFDSEEYEPGIGIYHREYVRDSEYVDHDWVARPA